MSDGWNGLPKKKPDLNGNLEMEYSILSSTLNSVLVGLVHSLMGGWVSDSPFLRPSVLSTP